jgi:hypothetical protein
MVPNDRKIGQQQLNVLVHADDIVLVVKNETEIRQLFVEMEDIARKLRVHINQGNKMYDSGTE